MEFCLENQHEWGVKTYYYILVNSHLCVCVCVCLLCSTTVLGGDGILVELSQILKDDAIKVMYSICQQIRKTQQRSQDWKRSVFILIPKKSNAKECPNCHTIALISQTSKVMCKILQARLQQYVKQELPDVQTGCRKSRRTRHQITNVCWIIEKQESSRKASTAALLTMPKALTVQITTNCGKFFKRWEYQTTLPTFWEICVWLKKEQLEPDMEQWTGSKLGTEYIKAVYFHPVYLTYMESISYKMSSWIKHSWNQDCQEKY